MSEINRTKVKFGDRYITLTSQEDAEHVQRVAEYLQLKKDEIAASSDYRRLTDHDRQTMLLFNLADDFIKQKDRADRLEAELKQLETESDDMRYRFVKERMKQENGEKR